MNAKEKIVPQRRFKKFKNGDDWEQRKLCNIVTNISDGDWIESEHIFNDGEYRIIQTGNLGEGIYLDKTNSAKFFYQKDFNQLNANEIFPGDILISRLAEPAGRTIILPNTGKRMVTSVDVTVIRPDDQNFDSMFLMTQMNSSKVLNEVNKSVSGTTHKRISRKNLEQIDLYVPHLAEQTVIGAFFKQIDNIIVLQKNKLDKLKELKLAYLSEMFPAEGELKPKRRFAGFTDDWEQRKLIDVADIFGGGTPSTTISDYWDGEIDWYSPVEIGEQVYVNGSQKKLTELGLKKSSAKVLPVGTVLFTSRAGIGKTAILAKEGATNQGFQSIVPHKNTLDSYFIYSRTNELKRYGEIQGAGSTFVEVSGKQMAKMPILIPILEEQTKIGAFFKKLDDTITLHQHKLEKLQNIKQAYLNEMFV